MKAIVNTKAIIKLTREDGFCMWVHGAKMLDTMREAADVLGYDPKSKNWMDDISVEIAAAKIARIKLDAALQSGCKTLYSVETTKNNDRYGFVVNLPLPVAHQDAVQFIESLHGTEVEGHIE
jgi:hypothetical protein